MIAQAEKVQADEGVRLTPSACFIRSGAESRVQMVADADIQVLELILQLAGGDLRKAITYLQTAQRLHSAGNDVTSITAISSEFSFFLSVAPCA